MIEVLQEKIVVLESENVNLKAEIENLRKEIIELQDKLGLNSKNSSLPPSHLQNVRPDGMSFIVKIAFSLGQNVEKSSLKECSRYF